MSAEFIAVVIVSLVVGFAFCFALVPTRTGKNNEFQSGVVKLVAGSNVDTVVFTIDRTITEEARAYLEKYLSERFPSCRICIVDAGATLTFVTKETQNATM